MSYTPQSWVDNQSPLTAARMNAIENGLAAAAQFLGSGTAFPTAGIRVGDLYWRNDLGTNGSLWQYTGNAAIGLTGWLRRGPGDTTIGENSLSLTAAEPVLAATPAWTDLAVVTATTYGGTIAVRWLANMFNGGSGSDRTGQFQVVCDGTSLVTTPALTVAIGSVVSGQNGPRITKGGNIVHTPTTGSHTWKVQGNASAASTLISSFATLTVVEK